MYAQDVIQSIQDYAQLRVITLISGFGNLLIELNHARKHHVNYLT